MKITAFFLFVSFSASQLFAQAAESKTTVAVLPPDITKIVTSAATGSSEVNAIADALTQKIVSTLVGLKRIAVVERAAMDKILSEQDFQMSDLAAENTPVRLGELMGADFLVILHLYQAQTTLVTQTEEEKQTWGDRGTQYSGLLEYGIRLVQVSTGEVTTTKNLKGDTGFLAYTTTTEALSNALNMSSDKLKDWLKTSFPVRGKIFEILKEKKGEAVSVAITCGSASGVRKNDAFKVVEYTEVELDGKKVKRSKDIGKIKVSKTESDGIFSTCEVVKGGKTITSKMKSGSQLDVILVKD